jgi:peroxiredoxin
MRPTWRALGTALLAAWALTAAAQDEEKPEKPEEVKEAKIGEPAPPIQAEEWANAEGQTVALDRFKDRIVVLFFFRTDDTQSVEAIPMLNEAHKDLGSRGLVIIGLTQEKKDKAESTIKGKEVKFIVGYGSKSAETYKVSAPAQIYLIDTSGRFVERFHALNEPLERIRTQWNKTPPPGADPKAVQNRLNQAKELFKNKEYGKAYTLAKDVSKLADKESAAGKAVAKLIEEIEAEAKKWLEEAKDAAKSKDYDKACKIVSELSVRFAGTQIGSDADTEIGKLMGDREVKAKIRTAVENAKGQLKLDQAADHEASKRYLEAVALYREITEKHPDTEAAKKADEALERIRGDTTAQETIKTLLAEEEADRWLDVADRFAKVQMNDKSREFYQRVIDSHPTARAATKAKDRLTKLPENQPDEDVTSQPASQPDKPAEKEKKPDGGKGTKPGGEKEKKSGGEKKW